MARKEFTFHGKTLDELGKMSISEFAELADSRVRRTLKRGITDAQKKVLKKLRENKIPETHSRAMVVVPEMMNKTIKIHDGRNFIAVQIYPEMLGKRLGDYVLTRKRVMHHAPGIGATRSSASLSVR